MASQPLPCIACKQCGVKFSPNTANRKFCEQCRPAKGKSKARISATIDERPPAPPISDDAIAHVAELLSAAASEISALSTAAPSLECAAVAASIDAALSRYRAHPTARKVLIVVKSHTRA